MIKRYIIFLMIFIGALILLLLQYSLILQISGGLIALFSIIGLINFTDILHRESFVDEPAEPILMDPRAAMVIKRNGNKKAVLLIHGFSSNPWLFNKHIPLFENDGYDIIAPRLPGHGTSPEEFLQSSFTQYYQCVEETLKENRLNYDHFHIIGISMGGLLTLKLGENYSTGEYKPTSITTLAAPARLTDPRLLIIRILSWIKPCFKGEWDTSRESDGGESWLGYEDLFVPQAYSIAMAMIRVRSHLKKITLPHLLIHAKGDKDVPFNNIWEIASTTSSTEQELWIPDLSKWDHSRHSLFLYDSLINDLFSKISGFIKSKEHS